MMTQVSIVCGLFVLGALFGLLEITLLPGFGVAGLISLASVLGSVTGAFIWFGPLWGGAVLIVAGWLTWWAARWFPNSPMGRNMVLTQSPSRGPAQPEFQRWLHKEGIAATPLRPSGSMDIGDDRIDVVTDGSYLEAGVRVKVIEVRGNRVVVQAAEQ